MNPSTWEAVAITVAACALVAWVDPASRLKAWWSAPASRDWRRRKVARAAVELALVLNAGAQRLLALADRLMPPDLQDAQRPGEAAHHNHHQQGGGEGAAPAVVAPSPVATCFVVEVLVDREIWDTNAVVLGTYLRHASKARRPEA